MIEKRIINGVEVGFDTEKQSYFAMPDETPEDMPEYASEKAQKGKKTEDGAE